VKALGALVIVVLLLMVVAGVLLLSDPESVPVAPPAAAPPAVPPAPPAPPDPLVAEMLASLKLQGLVLGVDGNPVRSGIRVSVTFTFRESKIHADSLTSDNGAFCLAVPRPDGETFHEISATNEETGDESGPARVRILPGCPPPFTLLRLRKSCRVVGRVVSAAGRPVPGAEVRVVTDRLPRGAKYPQASDTEDAVRAARTNREGRFEVLVRDGPGGRVAAVDAFGVSGPIRRFTPRASGVTDVGDLALRNERSADWTLQFVDGAGEPVADVNVWPLLDLLWHARVHSRRDPERGGIAADATGRIRLVLPCRSMPATVVLHSPTHGGRILTLDLRQAGPRDARVRLEPFPSVRIRVVGPTAKEILRRAKYFGAGRERQRKPPKVRSAFDVATGRDVPIPEAALDWCRLMHRPWWMDEVTRTGFDRFVLRAGTPGPYRIRLAAESTHWVLGTVEVPAKPSDREIELAAPAGRVVTIDCRKLNRWSKKLGTRYWVSPYSARSVVVGNDPETLLTPDGLPMVLLGDAKSPDRDEREMWVPPEHTGIRFGYPDDPVLMEDLGIHRDAFVPIPASRRVVAPVPDRAQALSVLLRVAVRRNGIPFRHPGLAVNVRRQSGGEGRFRTDANGEVPLRVFPGRYSGRVSRSAFRSSGAWEWRHGTPAPEAGDARLPLDFDFPR